MKQQKYVTKTVDYWGQNTLYASSNLAGIAKHKTSGVQDPRNRCNTEYCCPNCCEASGFAMINQVE